MIGVLKGLFILIAASASAHAFAGTFSETELQLHYQVHCSSANAAEFPGLIGEASFRGRSIRFFLFKYLSETKLSLGTQSPVDASELTFKVLPSSTCTLANLQTELHSTPLDQANVHDLARLHSPYLQIRPDQVTHPDRDVQLGIAYSVLPSDSGFSIRYTYFFSNETVSGLGATSKATSLGSWGRRSDVEWIYQVNFSADGKVLGRKYQGAILLALGHSTKSFKGNFLPHTDHPILYDIAKHNVFGTKPLPGNYAYQPVGVHLIPEEEIKAPLTREHWLWDRPWTFAVTDLELSRNGKLNHASDEYVYVNLSGELNGGKIQLQAKRADTSQTILAGDGAATIKRFGEDLWNQETFSAIRLDSEALNAGGTLHIKRSTIKTVLNPLRFYALVKDDARGFIAQEITHRFACESAFDCKY